MISGKATRFRSPQQPCEILQPSRVQCVCSRCAVARSRPFRTVPLRGYHRSVPTCRNSAPGAGKFHLVPYRSSTFHNRTKGVFSAYGSEGQGFESLQVHHRNLVSDGVFSFVSGAEMGGVPYACLTNSWAGAGKLRTGGATGNESCEGSTTQLTPQEFIRVEVVLQDTHYSSPEGFDNSSQEGFRRP